MGVGIRWTTQADQLLLLKIVETHKISHDAVAQAWPKDDPVGTPTARAILDRLIRLKKSLQKQQEGDTASPAKTPRSAKKGASRTPAKRKLEPEGTDDELDVGDSDRSPLASKTSSVKREQTKRVKNEVKVEERDREIGGHGGQGDTREGDGGLKQELEERE